MEGGEKKRKEKGINPFRITLPYILERVDPLSRFTDLFIPIMVAAVFSALLKDEYARGKGGGREGEGKGRGKGMGMGIKRDIEAITKNILSPITVFSL